MLIASLRDQLKIQGYDADHSIQAVDLEMQISKAASNLDPG